MATPATEAFPRKLRWKLLGFWVAFLGGVAINIIVRAVTGDSALQPLVALVIVIALLVQLWGVVHAIVLLRDARYQSRTNVAMTVAALVPAACIVFAVFTDGVRLHM